MTAHALRGVLSAGAFSAGIVLTASAASIGAQEVRRTDLLRGKLLSPSGQPVAGAVIEFRRRAISAFVCLDLEYARKSRRVRRTRSAADGTFAAHLPRGLACSMHIDVKPFARVIRDSVYGGENMVITLQPPATIQGRVVVAKTGVACAGVAIQSWDRANDYNRRTAESDAKGRFTLSRLLPGDYYVEAIPTETTRPMWKRVTLAAGQTVAIEMQSAPGKVLAGRVVDADTGTPIAGAEVGEGWTLGKSVLTDAAGRFKMLGFGGEGYDEVHFRASGYARGLLRRPPKTRMPRVRGQKPPPPLPADVSDLRLTLHRGCTLVGRILLPDGKPATGIYVAAVGAYDWLSARSDATGSFKIEALGQELEWTLLFHHDGWATTLYDLPRLRPGQKRQDLRGKPFTLQPRLVVQARIFDGGLALKAGTTVELWGYNTDRSRLHRGKHLKNPLGGVEHHIAKRRVRTDFLGRCHFGDLPAGRYTLRWGSRWFFDQKAHEFEVVAGQAPKVLEVRSR